MYKQSVNPWRWQDQLGFSQAWRVDNAESTVYVAGQAPISPDGQLVGQDEFEVQARQVFENLRTVLEESGATLDSIVKLTVYLTDMSKPAGLRPRQSRFHHLQAARLDNARRRLAGAAKDDEMMIEVDAIAVL